MKSNAPWSVKGIERDARETAKEAARREGMTVGEWLNRVIYTAGDPETSNGEIEGLKISDLVTAIEHLNKKVIAAESKGAAALDELSRNFGGVVERVQRLERVRPGEAGPDIESRLAKLESRANDRQRIDALRALEKAVSQVALQYDAAHKQTLTRLDATEKQLQEFASRLDQSAAGPGRGDGAASAIKDLREAIEDLGARVERAERIAAEASKLRDEAAASPDSEFVERTGARLRILGDEIKRGGDQMRALEATIKKMSDQIDAAERRSSEGVAKVAETIAELKARFERVEPARGDGVAAERLAELRRSFDAMTSKPAGDDADAGAPGVVPAEIANPEENKPSAASEEDRDVGEADEADRALDEDDEDEFSFDLDDESGIEAAETLSEDDALDEIKGASDDEEPKSADDSLNAIFAEFDTIAGAPPSGEASHQPAESPAVEESSDAAGARAPGDFLKQARSAAREAAQRAASDEHSRRRLTPKQRAILAAKIRRKRLAEEGLEAALQPAIETAADPAAKNAGGADEDAPSLASKAAGALSGLKTHFYGPAAPVEPASTDENSGASASVWRRVLARLKPSPLTAALIAAVILAIAALFFLIKDLIFVGAEPPGGASRPAASAPASDNAAPAGQSGSDAAIDAHALYLNSVAKLRSAKTTAETSAAIAGIEQAAELGLPPAQLQLGELYKLGQGVPEDLAKARAWYERAANGGNVLAMHRIGVMEARGQGGPRDEASAIRWFEKAGNFGLVDSQYNLGALYHPGGDNSRSGVQDAAKAYYWYSLAARNGDQQAGALAASLAPSLSSERLRSIDADIAAWKAATPDEAANEVAPAS
ncbi:MAG: hypothetical protein GC153_09095 [Alphaproteobacteria bacterium]|nr:hypothetical protein [Alphaproteobacteria bacterium]